MKDLFERLKAEGSAVVHELVSLRTQEHVQLDFKQKKKSSHGQLDRDDREVLGPALSALANSSGGLLILGVEANKKNPEKIDAAAHVHPISDLGRFKSEVIRATGDLLMPRHEGIQVEAIEEKSAPGTGYLVILVERSERRPHRSEASGDKRYYKRAGDSSFIMEHYDIEDSFNRIAPVELRLVSATPEGGSLNQSRENYQTQQYTIRFSLKNESRLSACAPYVWLEQWQGATAKRVVTGRHDATTLEESYAAPKKFFSGSGDVYIHPGLEVPAFDLVIELERYRAEPWTHKQKPFQESLVSFDFGVGCQNARMRLGRYEFPTARLVSVLRV